MLERGSKEWEAFVGAALKMPMPFEQVLQEVLPEVAMEACAIVKDLLAVLAKKEG